MFICLAYPAFYDTLQLYSKGSKEYFKDIWNFFDLLHIWIGFANIWRQRVQPDILNKWSQGLMMMVTLIMLIKTFFYLRIFKELSFLVSMIKQVFLDLRAFGLFYGILIYMFSLMLGILDWSNYEFNDDLDIATIQYTAAGPDKEYLMIPKMIARYFAVLRISLGDFELSGSTYLTQFQNVIYWIMLFVISVVTNIVFLNFIVAEVGSSYNHIKETLPV